MPIYAAEAVHAALAADGMVCGVRIGLMWHLGCFKDEIFSLIVNKGVIHIFI